MKSITKSRLVVLLGIIAAAPLALVFPACGVESPAYLQPPGGSPTVELTNKATYTLPDDNSSQFSYWSILYRIYVSGTPISGQIQSSSAELSRINSLLANDYSNMYPYTDMTNNTIQNTNIHGIFSNNGYYEIALEDAGTQQKVAISKSLDIFGKDLVFDFPPNAGSIPTLTVTDKNTNDVIDRYNLLRSTGSPDDGIHNNTNNPLPQTDRYFRNSTDLNASANNSKTNGDANSWNLDVADNSSVTGARYTYVSLYILALGRDTNSTWNLISSRPAFIAILRLPEK